MLLFVVCGVCAGHTRRISTPPGGQGAAVPAAGKGRGPARVQRAGGGPGVEENVQRTAPAVVDQPPRAGKKADLAALQGRFLPPQGGQGAQGLYPGASGVGVQLIPGHAAAAVRVMAAFQGQFGAVVQAGAARQRQQGGQLLPELVLAAHPAAQPDGVVRVQQRELCGVDLGRVDGQTAAHIPAEGGSGLAFVLKKAAQGALQRVVHDGVILVPLQPGRGVVPDLPQQVKVRLQRFEPGAQPPQEGVADLVAHVEAQAVDAVAPHPVFAQADQVLLQAGVVGVQLGHAAVEGKGKILAGAGVPFCGEGPLVHEEPVPPGGGRPMGHHVPPGGEVRPAVVEHGVQHDADALFVGLPHQGFQVGSGAEIRVHAGVVGGVVFMEAARGEDGVQVQPVDAEGCQIRQLLGDARQVAAEAFAVGHRAAPPGQRAAAPAAAPAEAVGVDLVPDGAAHPVRRGDAVGGVHPGHQEALHPFVQLQVPAQAVLIEIAALGPFFYTKHIAQAAVGRLYRDAPDPVVFQFQPGVQREPAALPAFAAACDARFIRVGADQFGGIRLPAGAQRDLQRPFVGHAAHRHARFMEDRSQIHRDHLSVPG